MGPAGSVVRKLLVFQIPPLLAPTKAVLPEGSVGSSATAPTGPARLTPPGLPLSRFPALTVPAGPTAVQVSLARGLAGERLNSRNPTVFWSATGWPRPVLVWGFWKFSDQASRAGGICVSMTMPGSSPMLVIVSVQRPCENAWLPSRSVANAASPGAGDSGLNVPKNGAAAIEIGAGGLTTSLRVVLVKLAGLAPLPTFENRTTDFPFGAVSVTVRSGSL